jgi:hypothetical protein
MFTLNTKDSHSLSPVEDTPAELAEGTKLKMTSATGSGEFTVTGFGNKRRQVYFKGQAKQLKEVIGSATKETPVKVDVEVL